MVSIKIGIISTRKIAYDEEQNKEAIYANLDLLKEIEMNLKLN